MKNSPQNVAYEYIRNQIVTKMIFPGNRISDEEVMQETGVSRTSIRAALMRLNYEGFVDMIPNRGAFVAKPNPEDLQQIFAIRKVLEIGAFQEAVEKRSGAHLQRMEKNLQDQAKLLESYSRLEYVWLNREFHWIIVEACGNTYYEKYLNEIYNKINTYMIFYDSSVDNDSMASHRMIYEGLKTGDVELGIRGIREDNRIALVDMRTSGMDV